MSLGGPAIRTEVWNDFDLGGTESPGSIGRTVVALLRGFDLLAKTRRMLTEGDLASEYGFTDIDGRLIPAFRFHARPSSSRPSRTARSRRGG